MTVFPFKSNTHTETLLAFKLELISNFHGYLLLILVHLSLHKRHQWQSCASDLTVVVVLVVVSLKIIRNLNAFVTRSNYYGIRDPLSH